MKALWPSDTQPLTPGEHSAMTGLGSGPAAFVVF